VTGSMPSVFDNAGVVLCPTLLRTIVLNQQRRPE
jgi:hypothetical protein